VVEADPKEGDGNWESCWMMNPDPKRAMDIGMP
jgi:hypothetical protein